MLTQLMYVRSLQRVVPAASQSFVIERAVNTRSGRLRNDGQSDFVPWLT